MLLQVTIYFDKSFCDRRSCCVTGGMGINKIKACSYYVMYVHDHGWAVKL